MDKPRPTSAFNWSAGMSRLVVVTSNQGTQPVGRGIRDEVIAGRYWTGCWHPKPHHAVQGESFRMPTTDERS